MTFAFFGTPEFAAIILEGLINSGMLPSLVICNPDKPIGRKKIITPPRAKVIAEKHGIKVYQPEKLEVRDFKPQLKDLDFAIVAAYAKILPKEIISTPKFGTIVVHPSLLPRYRGATPIQSAILSGDKVTGTTLILADEKVDHGPIIAGKELEIKSSDNYESLLRHLAELSAELLIKKAPEWLEGKIKPQIQNEDYATYTKKFTTEDAFIEEGVLRQAQDGASPEKTIEIERKVRALNPEPGVWTIAKKEWGKPFDAAEGKRTKILEVKLENGKLKLLRIQIEGKNPQNL